MNVPGGGGGGENSTAEVILSPSFRAKIIPKC